MYSLDKIRENRGSKLDLVELLTAAGGLQQELFARAREVRRQHHGDKVLLRGVIEISSHCQKNCSYCTMRSANKSLDRYSLHPGEILALAENISNAGLETVFLQGGQNPFNDQCLEQVIPVIKHDMNLEVLLCLGERPKSVYEKFARLGADSYILKFETSDPELYQDMAHASLANRLQCISWIKEAGLKLGTGNIIGLPNQTLNTIAEDIILALRIQPDFISCSPFTPGGNTPFQHFPAGGLSLTLNTMAIYRIFMPSALIPTVSALETLQKGGQRMGLDAGANVMTINFTPREKRELYKIYTEQRFVVSLDHVQQTAEKAGLRIQKRTHASHQA